MGLLYIILYIPFSKSLFSSIKTVKKTLFRSSERTWVGSFHNEKKKFYYRTIVQDESDNRCNKNNKFMKKCMTFENNRNRSKIC